MKQEYVSRNSEQTQESSVEKQTQRNNKWKLNNAAKHASDLIDERIGFVSRGADQNGHTAGKVSVSDGLYTRNSAQTKRNKKTDR